eukprot:6315329-Amphidinium_carterae.1
MPSEGLNSVDAIACTNDCLPFKTSSERDKTTIPAQGCSVMRSKAGGLLHLLGGVLLVGSDSNLHSEAVRQMQVMIHVHGNGAEAASVKTLETVKKVCKPHEST